MLIECNVNLIATMVLHSCNFGQHLPVVVILCPVPVGPLYLERAALTGSTILGEPACPLVPMWLRIFEMVVVVVVVVEFFFFFVIH